MSVSQVESQLMRILIGGACLVVIVAGMQAMANVLNIVFLAWLLAYAILPLPHWMIRHGLPEVPAVLGTLLIVIFGGITLAVVMSYSIVSLGQRLPTYETNLADTYAAMVDYLAARDIDLAQVRPLEGLTPARMIGYARMLLGQIGNLLGNTLLLVLLVAILLFEFLGEDRRRLEYRAEKRPVISIFQEASSDVQAYVAVTSTTGAMQALINIALYLALGIDFAVTWGILFFFMNFIPVVGGFIAIVPPVALGFLESGVMTAVAVLVLFTINNLLWDNVLKPRFMEKTLDLPFLFIILSLIFWSWVLGSVGTILAVPLTMVVRNLYYRDITGPAKISHSEEG
ncbi:MAG: AI-2E family transporter [Deltaproteobacteria bacterium]|jgi:predicted PurR-regulated permease PerM|nr:AI-2E family transporter [Deltaproteobacteria bacterium]MDX9761403.1 AI-2E family transporter [Desulfomonilia bacterium]HPW69654.1 AI-2E family transporter [Deltaproteobacteria bacterium]